MSAEVGEGVHCKGWTLRCRIDAASAQVSRWSAEEKRSICRETRTPGVSVAQVARRHALNANLIFKWLKDRRFEDRRPEAFILNIVGSGTDVSLDNLTLTRGSVDDADVVKGGAVLLGGGSLVMTQRHRQRQHQHRRASFLHL